MTESTSTVDRIELRYLKLEDYDDFKDTMIKSYPNLDHWQKHQIKRLLEVFPQGQVVATVDGKLVAAALSLVIDYQEYGDDHTYREVCGDYEFDTHDEDGDVLYGIDVFVHPEFRGLRLGRRLYDYRKEICEQRNLKAIVFGGRLPNYHEYSDELTPRQYITKVRDRELFDPVLTFQLSNDFHVKKVMKGYLRGDEQSQEYAALLQWDNIYYAKPKKRPVLSKEVVRLGLVQWQMRRYKSMEEMVEQVEFFVDALSTYRCDFALFPEFFNAPLMADYNDLEESAAIRKLAEHTEEIRNMFSSHAVSRNINIVTGSMPLVREDNKLYNVGFLCHRNGKVDEFEKIHVTPDEAKVWGMVGGNKLTAFDTDSGKVGVLICYDSEFPELGRILAEQGVRILFVPFLTDTQNGYSRVRHCARARAIENECYVAIAGCVGNLPKVHNMDIQFAQSVVFTPCDFSFPTDGIKAQATPNSEMILVADVDLDLLKELNRYGSVRNLRDRRKDLFSLTWNNKA